MKKIFKFIICDLLNKHIYKNQMCEGLYAEGVDEFYRCSLCGDTKIKYMWGDKMNEYRISFYMKNGTKYVIMFKATNRNELLGYINKSSKFIGNETMRDFINIEEVNYFCIEEIKR